MAADSGDLFQGLAILLGLGVLGVYRGLKTHKQIRSVQDTPRSKLESAPQGFNEFQGFAWPQEKHFDLFGGEHAVYYSAVLQVERTEGSGKRRKKIWRNVDEFSFSQPFCFIDPTGVATVQLQGAEWNSDQKVTRLWTAIKPDEQFFFLEKIFTKQASGFPPKTGLLGLFSQRFRVIETAIRVGCPLYVKGEFHTGAQGRQNFRTPGLTDFFNKVMNAESRSIKDVRGRLDKDKDGKVSAKEALQGYAFVARLALKNAAVQNQEERDFPIHGEIRSSEAHKLLIADCHEEHLIERMSRGIKVQLVGGAFMVVAALSAFLHVYIFQTPIGNAARSRPIAQRAAPHLRTTPVRAVTEPIAKGTATGELIKELHKSCYAGGLQACRALVARAKDFQLSETYTTEYLAQSCRLGHQESCTPARQPSSK